MTSKFQCPSCNHVLQIKHELTPLPERKVKAIVWCGNASRCQSAEATNNGGSGPTEEAAYRSLLLSVKHAEDRETERECELITEEEQKDRNAWAVAERKNDQAGCL